MAQMVQRVRSFVSEVKSEMAKVSWPTRTELVGSTTVVFVSVILLAIFIGSCDFLLSKFIPSTTRWGGVRACCSEGRE